MSVTAEALPTMSAVGELLELNAGLVGPSTGYMVGARGDWPRLIAAAESCSLDVVELSALSARDLVVERADGRVVALEVKLTAAPNDDDVRHLAWLGDRLGADLLDAAIVTTGRDAYRRPDGIAVIPAALLGP